MWMNSPLGKWEEEARVNKALQDAERMRAQEEGGDADGAARSGGLLQWLAARSHGAVESIQLRLAAPAAQKE